MKAKLITLMVLMICLHLFSQDVRSFTVEDNELHLEWQRYLVMQGLNESDLNEEEILLYQQSLEESLILRKILLALAEEKSLSVEDYEIEQIYMNLRNQVPTQSDWNQLLQQQFYDESSFREYLRVSELIDRLIKQEVLVHIEMTQEEVLSYYETHPEEFIHQGETLEFQEVEESLWAFLWDIKAQRATGEYMERIRAAMITP